MKRRTVVVLMGGALVVAATLAPAAARAVSCKEECLKQREQTQAKLAQCLRKTKLMGRGRAILVRKACLKKYVVPDCSGRPACPKEGQTRRTPGLRLGSVVFSAERRGPVLARAAYPAGSEMFFRVDVEVTSKPNARAIWLQLDLRLISISAKGKRREVVRWTNYLEQKKVLGAEERGTPKKYTLHGGAQLPLTFDRGKYEALVEVRERISSFSGKVSAPFSVLRARKGKAR